jgi:hypothetical protein
MAATIKVKRSAVSGNAPNTSNIDTGELALNTADGILYSSDGSNVFEVGANLTSLSVTGQTNLSAALTVTDADINVANGTILIDGNAGSSGQVLTSDGTSASWQDASGGGGFEQVFLLMGA